MRIRKGNQVEVWTQEAASPVGAWRGGEVQWGNGHSYVLRWHDGSPDSGRISRKTVRPRPPPAPVPLDLDVGIMVEVFDDEDCVWKCAEVERAPVDGGARQFRVKVVGAPKVLTVAPNRLRFRQMLRDDDVWVLLHKESQVANGNVHGGMHKLMAPGMGAASATPLRANGGNYKPMAPGFKPMKQKRAPSKFDTDEIANGQRLDDDTSNKKLCVREQPKLEVKVCLNKQDKIGSSSNEYCDVIGVGSNSDHDNHNKQQLQHHDNNNNGECESSSSSDSSSSSSSDDSSSDSDINSITRSNSAGELAAPAPASASCDHQKPDLVQQQFVSEKDYLEDIVSSGSCGQPPLSDEKAVVQDHIHRLELEAYTSLTRAFHASGDALSWEKADLLTDVRTHLHISNAENLQVINAVLNRKGGGGGGEIWTAGQSLITAL